MRRCTPLRAAVLVAVLILSQALAASAQATRPSAFDPESAVAYSQAAVGRTVNDYGFQDSGGKAVRLADFRGKPLVVNLVFTACVESCPLVVQSLHRAVDVAQEALGADSFSVVTIGFDAANDTPGRMHDYSRDQGLALDNWHFLSGKEADIQRLLDELGFLYFPSPRGFDHLAQTSVLDAEGRIHQQVYGASFEPPALVEPLKGLMFGRAGGLVDVSAIIERVRLFCTFYDPARDRYSFDYSFFFALAIGGVSLTILAVLLARAWLRTLALERRRRTQTKIPESR